MILKRLFHIFHFVIIVQSVQSQSDLQSALDGNTDIDLSGNYFLSEGIIVPDKTILRIYSEGSHITCLNKTFAFDVSPGSTLDLRGINIQNCSGSAIRTDSSILRIKNCTFENNKNISYGGAIFSLNSNVMVENSIFYENVATQGGSVYLKNDYLKNASFTDCSFFNNTAEEIFSPDYVIKFPFLTGGGAI